MSDTLRSVDVPADVYQAADWLRTGHPWMDQLARRITGSGESNGGRGWAGGDWLDELAGAVTD